MSLWLDDTCDPKIRLVTGDDSHREAVHQLLTELKLTHIVHLSGCALKPFSGFGVFNIAGKTCEAEEFLELIARNAEKLGMGRYVDPGIAEDTPTSMLVCDLDPAEIRGAFPGRQSTELTEGIEFSLAAFSELVKKGILAGFSEP